MGMFTYFLFKTVLTVKQRPSYRAMMNAAKDPNLTQEEVLKRIVHTNRDTEFGRKHQFNGIETVEQYRKQVPVHDFELLRPYIEKQRDTGAEALTAEPVVHYNRTSGTTGTPKDVPITQTGVGETRQLSQLGAFALIQQTSIFTGKVFAIGGAAVEGRTRSGTPIGSASGLIYRQQSRFVRTRYAIPPEAFDVQDSELRYVVMAIYGLHEQKVSTMATANPSTFVRLLEVINNNIDDILIHIEQGTLPDCQISLPTVQANPARAQQLRNLISKSQKLTYNDIWPKVKGVVVWCGGSCRFAVSKLRKLLPSKTQIIELGYNASEVRGTINVDTDKNLCLPSLQHVYFEFVTVDDWENNEQNFLGLHELQEDTFYYIFITTSSGLYRYNINDVVRVTGKIHATPTIEFVRKGRGVTNITGEKLTESQVMEGMERLCSELSIDPDFFVLLADEIQSSYILCIELNSDHDPTSLIHTYDNILQQLNIEYESKRKSERLGAMRYHRLPAGAGYAYRSQLISTGQRDSQFKYQHLQYFRTTSLQLDTSSTTE
ncbi:MAG: GH3 auxin-responsive promoter family protein [Gammaproteobacteria bacterium]|nr:GH3 auxin-responsive promoter family protein [Gammaproteobacteria bacterium]